MPARHLMRRSSMFAVATALAIATLAGPSPAAAQPPEEVLSHFLCYQGTFADFARVPHVGFQDQFAVYDTTVGVPRLLCDPVRKTRRSGEVTRIVDSRQHLKAYRLRTPTVIGTEDLLITNQFGRDRRITVDETPVRALVPTQKVPHEPPVGLDHFLCYPVIIGRAIDKGVRLRDQFDTFRTRVGEPRLHCNPTDKTHLPTVTLRQNPDAHLTCYGIERHRLDPPQRRPTSNRFEIRKRARVEVAVLLCVPSTKVRLPD